MVSRSGLDTNFFVIRKHELIVMHDGTLPASLVKIQESASLLGKARITGEYPTAVLPWLN